MPICGDPAMQTLCAAVEKARDRRHLEIARRLSGNIQHARQGGSLNAKTMKLPGPDHPIIIELSRSRVVVGVAKIEIANSRNALLLREASYPAVLYIPRKDADMSRLERSHYSTFCPYKGDCSYYSIPLGGPKSVNAVWTYERPYAAAAEIQGHLAFYRDRVDSMQITADSSP
jgi:uncharacterized protein (DUF427 family)